MAVSLSPGPTSNLLISLGNLARKRGNTQRAMNFYERASDLEPENSLVTRNMAVIHAEHGNLEEAERLFRVALSAQPDSAEALLGLGLVLSNASKPDEAAVVVQRAYELSRGQGRVGSQSRELLASLGQPVTRRGSGEGPSRLQPVTRRLLADVADKTGVGSEFVERHDLMAMAVIQIARGGMDRHRILYRRGVEDMDHLVAHECGHIVRLWTVPPERRMLPMGTMDAKVAAIHQLGDELTRLANEQGIKPEHLSKLFDMLYPGTIRQVTNFPIDIRIERWLFEDYPDLRDTQRRSLLAELEENRQVLAPGIASTTPRTILQASNAINCAFAIAVSRLYKDVSLAASYSSTAYWQTGHELLDLVQHHPDHADGDRALVDDWAEKLSVDTWYTWRVLGDLPAADAMVAA